MRSVLNFAYGSNLLTRRLRERAPSARRVCIACLPGHELRWHKLGRDGSGKCDAYATGDEADLLWGVVYRLALHDKQALDRAEGLGNGYQQKLVQLHAGTRVVEAMVYIATRTAPDLAPYDWYKAFVSHGAVEHQLPHEHRSRIEAVPSLPDPDPHRARLNRRILEAP